MKKQKIVLILVMLFVSGSLFAQSGWQWSYPFPQGNDLSQIKFLNSKLGFTVGGYSISKTTNGGNNWILKVNDLNYYRTLAIIDSNNIVVAGDGVFKSTNGGENWSQISLFSQLTSISFANNNY